MILRLNRQRQDNLPFLALCLRRLFLHAKLTWLLIQTRRFRVHARLPVIRRVRL